YPHRDLIAPPPVQPGVTVEKHASGEAALAWLTTERPVLIACVERADSGLNAAVARRVAAADSDRFDAYAWHLPWVLASYPGRRGHSQDWVATARVAIRAAVRLGDVTLQSRAHRNLAAAYTRVNRVHESYAELTCALELSQRSGDQVAQAHTHHHLSRTSERQ